MIRNFLHVGVSVEDLDKSIYFYKHIMQMKEEFRAYHSGEKISQVVGVDNAELDICMLRKGDVGIELIKYGRRINNEFGYRRQNEVGLIHIAFMVDDVEKEYERIMDNGYEFFAPPMVTRENGPKITYFKGPDNVIIEIYQKV